MVEVDFVWFAVFVAEPACAFVSKDDLAAVDRLVVYACSLSS